MGYYDKTLQIIKAGADYNVTGINGWTILHSAVSINSKIVGELLDLGISPEVTNNDLQTPLMIASKRGTNCYF